MRSVTTQFFVGILIAASLGQGGCTAPWTKKEPELPSTTKGLAIQEILESEERPKIIGEIASRIDGLLAPIEYQYFGFVTGLADTGGDTRPSPQREIMLQEMRAKDVPNPTEIMRSKTSAVVKLRAVCLPGARENDIVDVLVELSNESEATSLQNGSLLPASLKEVAYLGGNTKTSFEKARASGPIVILPKGFTNEAELDLRTGLILGGARILNSRTLGIRIRSKFAHVMTSSQVARAINDRFYLYDRADRKGAATPKDDDFVQIDLVPRYRYDTMHFIDTILSVPFLEKSEDRVTRIASLQQMLQEPTTAKQAALQLEAIGEDGVEPLKTGLLNSDPSIQFYAAYALAYLGDDACVPVLVELAQQFPDHRSNCLVALTIIEQSSGREALEKMLQSPDPEVRYGAFNALYRQNHRDSLVSGERIGNVLRLVQIPSQYPAIVVSLRDRPEIVIFGNNPPVSLQSHVEINPRLIVRPDATNGKIRVVRFELNAEEISIATEGDLRSVLNGIYRVGGTYSDMVQFLDETNRRGWLSSPLAIDPRPGSYRLAERMQQAAGLEAIDAAELNDSEIFVNDDVNEKPDRAWWDVRRLFMTTSESKQK